MALLSAGSARDSVRSMVLLRRLHMRRAAVIYSTGSAALSGTDHRFDDARAELRLLDELIMAAAGRPTVAFTAGESAPATPVEEPAAPADAATEPADVPTEENVLAPSATSPVPALRRSS
jgi:hypothetical protein